MRLTAVATLMAGPAPAWAVEPVISNEAWLRQFYERQLQARDRQSADPAVAAAAFEAFRQSLAPDLQALFDEVRDNPLPSDEPDGSILNYVFGWGALPGREIKLISIEERAWWRSLGPSAVVTLDIEGNVRDLVIKGEYDGKLCRWFIADIDYGSGGPDETLRGRLERVGSRAGRN
ncbi:MAG: hypothetical protein IPK59_06625 [Rhodospirillaceae bacterium]|nr:hypothetical protein [Rhodospirillaceae bacterium]